MTTKEYVKVSGQVYEAEAITKTSKIQALNDDIAMLNQRILDIEADIALDQKAISDLGKL